MSARHTTYKRTANGCSASLMPPAEIGAIPKGGCAPATSDLDGQPLRLFIRWSEAASAP